MEDETTEVTQRRRGRRDDGGRNDDNDEGKRDDDDEITRKKRGDETFDVDEDDELELKTWDGRKRGKRERNRNLLFFRSYYRRVLIRTASATQGKGKDRLHPIRNDRRQRRGSYVGSDRNIRKDETRREPGRKTDDVVIEGRNRRLRT